MNVVEKRALINQALADLELCEEDPNYRVDMAYWHNLFGEKCFVCLAGAYIAKSHNWPRNETAYPSELLLDRNLYEAMYFLENVRQRVEFLCSSTYKENRNLFKSTLRSLTDMELEYIHFGWRDINE